MPIPFTCTRCGRVVLIRPAEASRRKFCSSRCSRAAQRRAPKGKEVACAHCGAPRYVHPVHLRTNRTGRFFCGTACMHAFNGRERVTFRCARCGVEVSRPRCNFRTRNDAHFCSRRCDSLFHVGDRHAFWVGGTKRYRGPDWRVQRERAKQRDGHACQHCGKTGKLSVHHMTPYRVSQDNRLSNLVTLCGSCHRKADAAWQRENRQAVWPSGQVGI